VLLGRPLPGAPGGLGERYRAFARRLQQYTAPVTAKGIEDTALYRHHRLISVNDVGGDPDMFGMSVAAFHAASRDRALHWPATMLATSTHDAKRSEDVRARIDVISEMPAAWRLTVRRWSRLNRSHKRSVDRATAPTRNDEYLLYQTLVGSWPAAAPDAAQLADYAQRIDQTMLKSARESKLVTSWMNPNADYEAALSAFTHTLLTRRDSNLFLGELQDTAAILAWYGALNSITLATLKTLSPGVPDFYQGCEAIELSLVDPDNRRPVDFERRAALLDTSRRLVEGGAQQRSAGLRALLSQAVDGRAKFFATWRALQLRRSHDAVLRRDDYLALDLHGDKSRHALAFARRDGTRWVVAVGARLFASFGLVVGEAPIGAAWGDTALLWPADAPTEMHDAISGRVHRVVDGRLPLAELLRDFSAAALASE
jgi:(1->4)-alpha-D-glucan 1-alpha-D-glucosylmutase